MLVTLLPIVTLVRLEQSSNASVPDAGNAVGDRDAGQAEAVIECIIPNAGDAGADSDVGQVLAVTGTHNPRCW